MVWVKGVIKGRSASGDDVGRGDASEIIFTWGLPVSRAGWGCSLCSALGKSQEFSHGFFHYKEPVTEEQARPQLESQNR